VNHGAKSMQRKGRPKRKGGEMTFAPTDVYHSRLMNISQLGTLKGGVKDTTRRLGSGAAYEL